MIILAASETLAGVASAASQVTATFFGMELNNSTKAETYETLFQLQFAASVATIYTATANGPTFVRSISVVNNDTVVRTFKLFKGGTAAANAITPTFSLLPGGMATYEDQIGWRFYNSAGQELIGNGMPNTGAVPDYDITGFLAESISRLICVEANNAAPTASGTLYMQAIYLTAGTIVSNISFWSATTGAGTPTHWMFGLYSAARALLAASADQTTTAWAATTLKTLAMTAAYTIPTSGLYYIGMFMAATTVVTLKGNTAKTGGQMAAQAPILHGATSDTGLTTTLPANAGAITGGLLPIWCAVS